MRFYTKSHRYSCGIDLHARRMYIGALATDGQIRVHRNGPATLEHFLATIAPYREDLVVAVASQSLLRVLDKIAFHGHPHLRCPDNVQVFIRRASRRDDGMFMENDRRAEGSR